MATGRELHRIPAHLQWIDALDFTPDGRTLASGGAEDVIRLWDVATGTEQGTGLPRNAIRSVAISPDGRGVMTGGSDGTIREWDPSTGRPIRLVGSCNRNVQALAYTPDGTGLVTGSYDFTCRLWDLATGEGRRRFDVIDGWIRNVAVSPDGRRLLSSMKVFDLATGHLEATFLDAQGKEYPTPNYLEGLFTPDSAGVLARTDEGVLMFDASSGRRLGVVARPARGYYAMSLSDDGLVLATGDVLGGPDFTLTDPSIRLWEVTSGRELARLGGDGNGHLGGTSGRTMALAFSHDGRWLASGSDLRISRIRSPATWTSDCGTWRRWSRATGSTATGAASPSSPSRRRPAAGLGQRGCHGAGVGHGKAGRDVARRSGPLARPCLGMGRSRRRRCSEGLPHDRELTRIPRSCGTVPGRSVPAHRAG